MYSYSIEKQAEDQIKNLSYKPAKQTIIKRLGELQENPYIIAKETGKPILGKYYINAGNRYSIVFNVDKKLNKIDILQVLSQPKLHKLITGRL